MPALRNSQHEHFAHLVAQGARMGKNEGTVPADIIDFYAGTSGVPLSIKEANKLRVQGPRKYGPGLQK
jgi:hypothetical protein